MKSISHSKPIPKSRRGGVKQERNQAIALAALCLALFMATLDDTVVNVALPQIQRSLEAPVSGLQWILNAYTLPIACLVLPIGTIADTYGRKRVFLTGLILFTLASLLSGLAVNLTALIAGRILQGVGAAAMIPGSLAILADTFPEPKEQAKAIGLWTAISGLALLTGPVLGGGLVEVLGWQSVFLLNLPLGIVVFVLTQRFIPVRPTLAAQPLDLPGMGLSILLLASLASALTEGRSPWLLLVTMLSLISFVVVESRSRHPMLPLSLFKNATFTVMSLVNGLFFFTLVSSLFIFSLFLQQIQGYSAADAGLRFLPLNGAFVFSSLVSGWLATRFGLYRTITAGLVLVGAATLSFVSINAATEYGTIAWKLVLSGLGGGLALPSLASAAIGAAPSRQAGISAAILNTTTRLGGILGIALQGAVLSQQMTSNLRQRLLELPLSPQLQHQILVDALQYISTAPQDLPANVAFGPIQDAIQSSFVSGLHATALAGGLMVLMGSVMILWIASSSPQPMSH